MKDDTKPMFGLDNINSVLKSISADYEYRLVKKLNERGFKNYSESYYFTLNELLVKNGPAKCADMANSRGVATQTIGKQLTLMEKHGYVSKSTCKMDSRANDINLTKIGHELIQALIDINEEICDEYQSKIGDKNNSVIDLINKKLKIIAESNDIKLIVF